MRTPALITNSEGGSWPENSGGLLLIIIELIKSARQMCHTDTGAAVTAQNTQCKIPIHGASEASSGLLLKISQPEKVIAVECVPYTTILL